MSDQEYDSTYDTMEHICQVARFLANVNRELTKRAAFHDRTKLFSPEKEAFDRASPQLKHLEYGTHAYYESLEQINEALDHHYRNNSHHPEHYSDGIVGMDLFDLIEMVADWKAASMRMKSHDQGVNLEHNAERFGIDSQLYDVLKNTLERWPHNNS